MILSYPKAWHHSCCRCLGVSNEAMVTKTVANISSGDAVALLEVAVQRLKTRANRGHNLSVWIRAVLMKHTAALMASPGQHPGPPTLTVSWRGSAFCRQATHTPEGMLTRLRGVEQGSRGCCPHCT